MRSASKQDAHAAQLERGQAFAQGVKLERGLGDGVFAQQVGVAEPGDVLYEHGEGRVGGVGGVAATGGGWRGRAGRRSSTARGVRWPGGGTSPTSTRSAVLVAELYGHPDAAIARQRTRDAFDLPVPTSELHAA